MSFIAVTFGYNQFNIFNTNTSTATFIDKIKEVAIGSILTSLSKRDAQITKEIADSDNKEENLRKAIKIKEQELKTELDRQAEARKNLEEQLKKEQLAAQKQAKGKKGAKATPPAQDKTKKKKKNEEEADNKLIQDIREEIEKKNTELQNLGNSKGIFQDKKKKLADISASYKKMQKNKANIVIDLFDTKGDKVNIYNKLETYANEYLQDKTVYDLMIETKNEKGEPNLEPFRFDGYCMRSIDQDKEWEETEKLNAKNKKPAAKKK